MATKYNFIVHTKILYIYYFRERNREQGEGGEGEEQADSMLSTEAKSGLHLMALRSQPEPKSRARHLTQ